jgi:hypothetical protein
MAERLAESVECDVDASMEGTKRLEQEFSRVRRTLNNNDTHERVVGKIVRLLIRDLRRPVVRPLETNPHRHSPVGGCVTRHIDVEDAVDMYLPESLTQHRSVHHRFSHPSQTNQRPFKPPRAY